MSLLNKQKQFIEADGSRLLIGPRVSGKTTCLKKIVDTLDVVNVAAPKPVHAFGQANYTSTFRGKSFDTLLVDEIFYFTEDKIEAMYMSADTLIAVGTPRYIDSCESVLRYFDDFYTLNGPLYPQQRVEYGGPNIVTVGEDTYLYSNTWRKITQDGIIDTKTSNVVKAAAIGELL